MIVLGRDFKTTPAKPRAIHNVRIFPALPKVEETSGGQPYRQSRLFWQQSMIYEREPAQNNDCTVQKQLIGTGYRSITECTCRKKHVSEGGEE
ncbi:hypothetical protein EmuJ_001035300 [Echinococcus multilocularis]|uniref:Uncharacterized protein n=1 Tax=Echinococcus multilocularis TaxID=6211 RepID=A0A068YCY8_ECHMU|nr:hypothetical protein EmuJ_001035300 [Echinococcus multilocularis]